MQLLSNNEIQHVSGGLVSKASYDSHVEFWSLIGFCTAAASTSLIPAPFGAYFAVRFAALGAGALAGYAFGAAEYYITNKVKESLDYYLAPAQ